MSTHTTNARHWPNAAVLLGQSRRRWSNNTAALGQCLVFARMHTGLRSMETRMTYVYRNMATPIKRWLNVGPTLSQRLSDSCYLVCWHHSCGVHVECLQCGSAVFTHFFHLQQITGTVADQFPPPQHIVVTRHVWYPWMGSLYQWVCLL